MGDGNRPEQAERASKEGQWDRKAGGWGQVGGKEKCLGQWNEKVTPSQQAVAQFAVTCPTTIGIRLGTLFFKGGRHREGRVHGQTGRQAERKEREGTQDRRGRFR